MRPLASPARYGTERMRRKFFVVGAGVLVKISAPGKPAGFVTCGTQPAGARLKERSNA